MIKVNADLLAKAEKFSLECWEWDLTKQFTKEIADPYQMQNKVNAVQKKVRHGIDYRACTELKILAVVANVKFALSLV